MLTHSRAKGDTLTKFRIQLEDEGQPIDLTGLQVKFTMADYSGNIKIPETAATITNAVLGYVEYDFQPADVNTVQDYVGYFIIYGGTEPETFPPDDEGILIEIFDRAAVRLSTTGITNEELLDIAKSPRRTRTVEGTVEERSVDDLIKANRYLTNPDKVPWGIRIARTKPPGTCS